MPSDTDTDSDSSAPQLVENEDNRLSDDEEFPISEDEDGDGPGDEDDLEDDEDDGDEDEDKDEAMSEEKSDQAASDSDEDVASGINGWAASMAKVLKSDKTSVLSKAKKVEDVDKKKEKKAYEFEIDGEVKPDVDEKKPDQTALELALEKRKYKERRDNKLRVFSLRLKPSVTDLDRERTFKKIATRGVVQLFNAVKSQQSNINRQLMSTKLESKREEIIRNVDNKKKFLDQLMSGPRSRSELVDQGVKKEKKEESSSEDDEVGEKSTWSALRNDFMTGKKVGWDKDDSDDQGSEEMESDSD